MGSVLSALMEINAEKEFQLLRQHKATSALWFLWVLKERREACSPGPPSTIALWMTRGLMLSPLSGLSTPTLLGVRRAA